MIGKVTVDLIIDADSLRDAVKMLDVWLLIADDERLIRVRGSNNGLDSRS